jgi:hypothetical protein
LREVEGNSKKTQNKKKYPLFFHVIKKMLSLSGFSLMGDKLSEKVIS